VGRESTAISTWRRYVDPKLGVYIADERVYVQLGSSKLDLDNVSIEEYLEKVYGRGEALGGKKSLEHSPEITRKNNPPLAETAAAVPATTKQPQKGPSPSEIDTLKKRISELERENSGLKNQLAKVKATQSVEPTNTYKKQTTTNPPQKLSYAAIIGKAAAPMGSKNTEAKELAKNKQLLFKNSLRVNEEEAAALARLFSPNFTVNKQTIDLKKQQHRAGGHLHPYVANKYKNCKSRSQVIGARGKGYIPGKLQKAQ
jgi:hypothetical protein